MGEASCWPPQPGTTPFPARRCSECERIRLYNTPRCMRAPFCTCMLCNISLGTLAATVLAGPSAEPIIREQQRLSPALQGLKRLNHDRANPWLADVERMRSRSASPERGQQNGSAAQSPLQEVPFLN